MKGTLFDDLTRSLALGNSRRQVLKFLTTGLAGGLFLGSKNATARSAAPTSLVALQAPGASFGSSSNPTPIGPSTFEVLSYRKTGYRFKINPLYQAPPRGFEREDFDDTNFDTGNAAFGSQGTCPLQSTVGTLWPLLSQLIVRRFISIPTGATGVRIMISVDNDIVGLFFNGVQIAGNVIHEECPVLDQFQFDVPTRLVRPGMNLIAVHVMDRGTTAGGINESFFDMRILAELPVTAPEEIITQITSIVDNVLPLAPLANLRVTCEGDITQIVFVIEQTGQTGDLQIRRTSNEGTQTVSLTYLVDGKLLFTSVVTNDNGELRRDFRPGPSFNEIQNVTQVIEALTGVMRRRSILIAFARCNAIRQLDSGPRPQLERSEADSDCEDACFNNLLAAIALGGAIGLAGSVLAIFSRGRAVKVTSSLLNYALSIAGVIAADIYRFCVSCCNAGCTKDQCAHFLKSGICDVPCPECCDPFTDPTCLA